MHPNTFLDIVQKEAGLATREEAEEATEVVFQLLHQRLTDNEAHDLQAQLPQQLARLWEGGDVWTDRLLSRFTPHNKFNRREFIREVESKKAKLPASGERITQAVFYALQSQISPGEAQDVAAQLPPDLRALWDVSSPLRRPRGAGGEQETVEVSPGSWEI